MEAEDIIVNKSYLELTEKEKSLVSEWVKNEDEFNVMKEFLFQTKQLAEAQKIEASPSVRENVFSYLHESPIKKNNFFQRFLLFLFPTEKPFYRYPSFQLACIFVLFFGVFKIIDSPLKPENNMAVHSVETSKSDELKLEESQSISHDSFDRAILDSSEDASIEMSQNKEVLDNTLQAVQMNYPASLNELKNEEKAINKSNDFGYFDDLSDEVGSTNKVKTENLYKEEIAYVIQNAETEQEFEINEKSKSLNQTTTKVDQDKKSVKKDQDRNNQKSTTAYEDVNNAETVVTSGETQLNSPATGGAVFTSSSLDVDTKTVQSIPLSKTNELKGFFYVVND